MVDVASLGFDVTFKKAFGQPDVFCRFVQDVLGISISVDKVTQDYRYPDPAGYVDIKYDLFAEDLEQRVIVEIQHIQEVDFFDRFLYHHLIGLIEQVKSHIDYRFNKTVYTVVVLTGVSRPRKPQANFSVAISEMDAINEFDERLGVYHHKLIFLNPRLRNENTPERIKTWLELIDDSLDEQVDETKYDSPIFQQVIEDIKRENISPQELREIKDQAVWDSALREQVEDIAFALLGEGVSIDLISRTTGLTP